MRHFAIFKLQKMKNIYDLSLRHSSQFKNKVIQNKTDKHYTYYFTIFSSKSQSSSLKFID